MLCINGFRTTPTINSYSQLNFVWRSVVFSMRLVLNLKQYVYEIRAKDLDMLKSNTLFM
jgi:hypothetical protein